MSEIPHQKKYRMAIQRPVAISMFFMTLIVFGWKSYQQLPVNLMPNISYPTLTVRTEYEGAAPEDVEKLVTRPLEEALSIVGGLVEISSVSTPSISEIVLEFTWGTDMNVALQEVRDRLDLFDPPKEVTEKPVILRYDPSLDPVLRVAITGSDFSDVADPVKRKELEKKELTSIRESTERHLKSDLEAEAGIAQVLVTGGRQKEIQVRVDSERLKNIGISLQDIVSSLGQQNINLSGGRLREGKTEYLVRTLNEFQNVGDIGSIVIVSGKGQKTKLTDVADVSMGEKQRDTIVHIGGKEAVALDIFKEGDANTVKVCNHVKDLLGFERAKSFSERLLTSMAKVQKAGDKKSAVDKGGTAEQIQKKIRSYLSENAKFTLISDQSRFIKGAIKEVQDATIQGGLLALIVLFLFLREISTILIIGLAIPISLITAFVPMYMWGITLNVMSLGGLALGVGNLIDDSIVVLESIFRCSEEGDSRMDAAERGTQEVFVAVISTTLTTVVVFLPIAFVEGVAGQMFGDFGFSMTFALLASMIVALYLNPMMVARSGFAQALARNVVQRMRPESAQEDDPDAPEARPTFRSVLGFVFNPLVTMTMETFSPTIEALRSFRGRSFVHGAGAVLLYLLILPLVTAWYLLKLLLLCAGGSILFLCLAVVLTVGAVCWFSLFALKTVLWIPLKLFDFAFAAVRRVYATALWACLKSGPIVLLVLILLTVHAGYVSRSLGRELLPPLRQGEFGIRMEAPPGTRLEDTEARAHAIEEVLLADPDVGSVGLQVGVEKTKTGGERGENIATFSVLLKDPEKTSQRQDPIVDRLRTGVAAVSSDQVSFTLPTLFSFKTAIELQIRGDDFEELKRVGQRALEAVRDIDGLKDAELSVKKGYPEIILELDRDLLATMNLTPTQIAQRLRTEVQGDVATKFSHGGEKIDIRVRSDEQVLQSLQDLRNASVVEGAVPVPLSSVAKITVADGPSEIRRVDQRQVVMVRGNVEGFDLGRVTREIERRLEKVEKPKDYSFVLGGQNRDMQRSYSSLVFALILSIFLVYAIMACQFESLIQPMLVMSTIPMAFVGVIYTLYGWNMPLSVAVFMGGILLVGIVVDNGMLLVDYANQLRERGRSRRESIYESGQVRFRPVIMTALTTAIGMAPMAWYTGEGAELRRPLAITVIAGLACATVLTLIVIPVVYDMFGGRDRK